MTDCKRLEIIIDALHVDAAAQLLRDAGVSGYTVLAATSGWGDRGERVPDGVSRVFENRVVLCACQPEQLDAITAGLGPLLARYGGVALVSDASLMSH